MPEAAARVLIRDLAGADHALEELWREKTALLVFLRHFG